MLDSDGKRIVGKYYNNHFATYKEQRTFEKLMFDKTKRQNGMPSVDGATHAICVWNAYI